MKWPDSDIFTSDDTGSVVVLTIVTPFLPERKYDISAKVLVDSPGLQLVSPERVGQQQAWAEHRLHRVQGRHGSLHVHRDRSPLCVHHRHSRDKVVHLHD